MDGWMCGWMDLGVFGWLGREVMGFERVDFCFDIYVLYALGMSESYPIARAHFGSVDDGNMSVLGMVIAVA